MPKILKFIIYGLLLILAFYLILSHMLANPATDHPFFEQFDEYPLVVAHAGSELYPTDTLFALEQYAAMGVDVLEMDVHRTADGEVILIHDDTVDRTTDGTGDVREMTLAEVQALDAGYYWTDEDGSHPFRGQGVFIPTLDEVLNRFPGYPMVIEIKQDDPPMESDLCYLLEEYEMDEKVIVASFHDDVMQRFREVCPQVATAASKGEVIEFVVRSYLLLPGTLSPEYHALQVPEKEYGIPIVNRFTVWAANRRNLQIHIWTVNDPEEMQHFIDIGVHGIMTDRTDLLLHRLNR